MKRFCRLFIFLIVLSGWIPNLAAAQDVNMPDATLAAVVRAELGLAPNAPITRQALSRLTTLSADRYREKIRKLVDEKGTIKDLTGLEHATNLRHLVLSFHDISDLGPLKGLTRLPHLYLSGNEISDLGPLAGLTGLETLFISYNPPINDFRPLAGLRQLDTLTVSVRSVAVMDNLRRHVDLTQLEFLSVHGDGNQIGDLHLFANLTQLWFLSLHDAQFSDVKLLANLTQLTHLRLGRNEIRDVKPLAGLTQLIGLGLNNNQIRDVTPLANLTQLKTLDLRNNQIRDVTPLAGLTQLEYLDLRNNQIRDVTPIQHLIDSPSTSVLLDGNPIGGGSDLVIETFQANRIKSPMAIRLTGPGPGEEISSILPGQKFDLYATVKNHGTEKSEATTVKFYRATDKDISPTTDQLLGTSSIEALPADDTVKVSFRVTAPKVGTYYYACVDSVDNEEKPDNNCTTALEIKIRTLAPDLQIESIKVAKKGTPPDSPDWKDTLDVKPGEAFDLRVIVLNAGNATAEATTVKFYRSTDKNISEADEVLPSEKNNNSLLPKTRHLHIATFQIPETGTYYYGAKVVPVADESDTDNWSVGVRIGAEALEPPSNLISDIVLTQNATYFVVNAQFPKLLIKDRDQATYGGCVITLDIEGVPDLPWEDWKANDPWITGEPPLFYVSPPLTPAAY